MSISVDGSDPATPVVRVGGELTFTTAAPLRAEVDRLLAEGPGTLVLDFRDLLFIDSTGLSMIVHAWRQGKESGTEIQLREIPRFLATILDMTGVSGLLSRPQPNGRSERPATDSSAFA